MSQRYIGNYGDYVSNLGSRRCCNVPSKEIPVVGPTGPPGPQGFVGNASTGPTGPIGVGITGATGPPGGMNNVNQSVTVLTDTSGCIILNASNYFSTSWSLQKDTSTPLYLSFQNFIVNGVYRLYLTNMQSIKIISNCATIYSTNAGDISTTGTHIIDIKYVGSDTYYLTISGPYE